MERGRQSRGLFALYGAVFLAAWAFLFWKCRFGFGNIDESFYLTVPYRLCRGDTLLLHEWHLSQTSGFLLVPAMRLFLLTHGSTAGILLWFRRLYTAVWGLAALFFCFRLRRFSLPGAMLASLVFLLYAPFGIMALSYNSMGILLLLNAGILGATARRYRALQLTLAGLFLAGAVLCCPYLLLLYLLFTLPALAAALRKRADAVRCWLFVSLGALLLFLLFCACILPGGGLAMLPKVLPLILNDPEHPPLSLWYKARRYLLSVLGCSPLFPPALLITLALTLICRRRGGRVWGFAAVCLCAAGLELWFFLRDAYLNYFLFPLCLPGFYCALCGDDPEALRLFRWVWLPGLVYSFCIHLSSNQEFYAISSAATVMSISGVVLSARFLALQGLDALPGRTKCAAALLSFALLMALQLGAESVLRYRAVFWESAGMGAQTAMAEEGPERGLRMTPARLRDYEARLADAAVLREDAQIGRVLFLSENTWLYLCAEKDFATYSAWLSGVNENSLARLEAYFTLFPERTPDAVCLDPGDEALAAPFEAQGYERDPLPSGALLLRRDGQP